MRLKELRELGKIDSDIYEKMYPTGSQPARSYGLAKVHKNTTPVRHVLSMSWFVYHPIANVVTEWLNVVEECQINTSSKKIEDSFKSVKARIHYTKFIASRSEKITYIV